MTLAPNGWQVQFVNMVGSGVLGVPESTKEMAKGRNQTLPMCIHMKKRTHIYMYTFMPMV